MFEYTKTILRKVSFDSVLFKKELEKAMVHLSKEESFALKMWAESNFMNRYEDIIKDVFENNRSLVNV